VIPDRAADRHPPLPALVKGPTEPWLGGRSTPNSATGALADSAADVWRKTFATLRTFLTLFLVLMVLSPHADAELRNEKEIQAGLKQHGIAVYVGDFVSGGCWSQAKSARKDAVKFLDARNMSNMNSNVTLAISAIGYRYQGICVVMLELHVGSEQERSPLLHYYWRKLLSGPETSDIITLIVRDFIEDLVAAMVPCVDSRCGWRGVE
jgi:hypothetical protein